jgi:hypothetical protein
MAVSFSELKSCPRCGQEMETDKPSETGSTGFACHDFLHCEVPEPSEAPASPTSASDGSNDDVAQVRRFHFPRLRTLRDLELAGRPLEVGCFSCGIVERLQPSKTCLDLDLAVADAANQLACTKCGKRNGTLFYFIYAQPARRS